MVWGMSLPSGFGDFWPLGAFELDPKTGEDGWSQRLAQYYLAQSPEEQRRLLDYGDNKIVYGAAGYGSYVWDKFIHEPGADKHKADLYHFGSPEHPCSKVYTPVEPHEAPQFYQTEKSPKSLGAMIQLNGRILAVDEALKAIIERFEPGVHQFFPIEIKMPKGKVYPEQYYTLVIGQFIDSFSPENSDPYSWHDYKEKYPDFYYYYYRKEKAGITGLALSKTLFGRANLWRERRFNGILICLSDELQAEAAKAGQRLPQHYKMREI